MLAGPEKGADIMPPSISSLAVEQIESLVEVGLIGDREGEDVRLDLGWEFRE